MSEWTSHKLAELIDIKHGFAFKGEYFGEDPDGPILVTPGNFAIGGGFKEGKPKSYSGVIPEGFILSEGDLVVTMTDLSKAADTLGYASLIPGGKTYLHNQRIGKVVILKPGRVEKEFLHYALRTDKYRQHVVGGATGTTVKHTSPTRIGQYTLSLPPVTEQQAIAAVLRALDGKIAINERIAATYQLLLQLKFAELGLSREPNGGAGVAVTELVEFNPKMAKPSAEEPVYVDMAALPTNQASIPCWTRRPPKSGPRFMNGDTLLARITPCLENGKTGYVDFMEDGEVGLGSTEFIVMRSRRGVPAELSYFLARDDRFREHAIRNMIGSSGRQRVSAADVANYVVNRPGADVLAAFGCQAETAFAHMRSLGSENRNLASLRDTLLPQLMSGRLRVKKAEKIVEDHT
ncbi:restriction endonuclease subunit S [Streptomyces sp. Ag109_G2-15]|uniref:restriction endonuclease subunit S n=1 Tax=Streptomyces sp. Ag109_G2-15 TaxID=1938850 RepID=UPI000BD4FA28|nr:restriction endonuclease subunit S [Streptomyces sp. Ag109_G2-15]SOD85896.1 type I restriction enzyme, S subunit [Streptomyces sp. Ag109_G2-15]